MSQYGIRAVAQALCAAVMDHAAMCEAAPHDSSKIVPMVGRIQDLVRAYGDVLLEESGWSNPLSGIEEVTAESPVEPSSAEGSGVQGEAAGARRTWVSVVDNQAVFVEDPDGLVAYAEERTGQSLSGLSDALRALCLADGWDPSSYPAGRVQLDWRSTDACTG